jgi:hypothetical protein
MVKMHEALVQAVMMDTYEEIPELSQPFVKSVFTEWDEEAKNLKVQSNAESIKRIIQDQKTIDAMNEIYGLSKQIRFPKTSSEEGMIKLNCRGKKVVDLDPEVWIADQADCRREICERYRLVHGTWPKFSLDGLPADSQLKVVLGRGGIPDYRSPDVHKIDWFWFKIEKSLNS